MEQHTSGIIPLADFVERSKDHIINHVPEYTDYLYLLTTALKENALLPHLKYAAIDGSQDSYLIVKEVSGELFGTPLTDEELEKVMEYYTKVHIRLEEYNAQAITEQSATTSIMNLAILQTYLAVHGPSDPERPITVDYVGDFITTIHEKLNDWQSQVGRIERYRSDFCRDLKRLVEADLVDEDMLEQFTYLAQTVNITAIRPLDYMCSDIESVNATNGANAHYRQDTHAMNVNVVTGMHNNLTTEQARTYMRHMVYHELVHSITLPWVTANGGGGYDREWQFPKFITEAMAERMTTVMLGQRQAKIEHDYIHSEYNVMRKDYGDYPYVFLPEGKQRDTLAYQEYTYLLDMFMAKLDWEAAGLTQAEAEKLLSRALFDGPSKLHEVDKSCTHWHAFHEALTKASFSGILVHLRDIFEHEGEEQMLLNYFDSPGFDPHDRDSLPRTLTGKLYDWRNYRYPNFIDEAPDTTLVRGYAQQLFGYLYGQRSYEIFCEKGEEADVPSVEREYVIPQLPTRFFALKAMTREMMDRRAQERTEMLKKRWYRLEREKKEAQQKTPV